MRECWARDPSARPSMSAVVSRLIPMLSAELRRASLATSRSLPEPASPCTPKAGRGGATPPPVGAGAAATAAAPGAHGGTAGKGRLLGKAANSWEGARGRLGGDSSGLEGALSGLGLAQESSGAEGSSASGLQGGARAVLAGADSLEGAASGSQISRASTATEVGGAAPLSKFGSAVKPAICVWAIAHIDTQSRISELRRSLIRRRCCCRVAFTSVRSPRACMLPLRRAVYPPRTLQPTRWCGCAPPPLCAGAAGCGPCYSCQRGVEPVGLGQQG